MNKICITLVILWISAPVFTQNIQLPAPKTTGGKPFLDVLSQRQTVRNFSEKELDKQTLSNLLWAAYGFNREDKRVVPSSQNRQEIDLYVVLSEGVYFYDAKTNLLILRAAGDFRKKAGTQDFVATAPVNLVMVCNLDKASNRESGYIDSGYISQNIYLFCASEGNLGTVVRGSIDKEAFGKILQLTDKQEIIVAQTVGYVK